MTAITQRPMPPVVVIDSLMGAGKTTYIIDYMNAGTQPRRGRATDWSIRG
jgi:hypothetical protein